MRSLIKKILQEEIQNVSPNVNKADLRIIKQLYDIMGFDPTDISISDETSDINNGIYKLKEKYDFPFKTLTRIINLWAANYRENNDYENITEWSNEVVYNFYMVKKTEVAAAWVKDKSKSSFIARSKESLMDTLQIDYSFYDDFGNGVEWEPVEITQYINNYDSDTNFEIEQIN